MSAFALVFLTLATLPMPFSVLPFSARLFAWPDRLWQRIVPIAGERLFHVNAEFAHLGSGDMVFHYVRLFVWAVIALVAAVAWSVFDRHPAHYAAAQRWFVVFCRFALAFSLVAYATAKVIPVQFPRPALDVLILPIGSASKFTLLYAFMGASPGLQRLLGWMELVSALLLTVRRTSLLGALLALGVLSAVAAINFNYGLPAKIQALHLMALAVAIIVPHRRRLALFLLDRGAPPSDSPPLFSSRSVERWAVALRTVIVIFVVSESLHRSYSFNQRLGDAAARSPLRGVWNVEVFEYDGGVRPPLVTDSIRWRRVVFDDRRVASIYDMRDRREWFHMEMSGSTINLSSKDHKTLLKVAYRRSDRTTLILETIAAGHRIRAICRLQNEANFPLLSERFRWTAITYDE